ncbi:MAG: hypothetical protein HY746_04945 [Elusimicrobia bacterium]|nr:hypothetical protein [Elusimicrobiota bacterium]
MEFFFAFGFWFLPSFFCVFVSAGEPADIQNNGDSIKSGLRPPENLPDRPDIDPFAEAVSVYFSASELYNIFESTRPERILTNLLRNGFYRQEILMMIEISSAAGKSFADMAEARQRGMSFEKMAKSYKLDLMEIFQNSAKTKKDMEAVFPYDVDFSTDSLQSCATCQNE